MLSYKNLVWIGSMHDILINLSEYFELEFALPSKTRGYQRENCVEINN